MAAGPCFLRNGIVDRIECGMYARRSLRPGELPRLLTRMEVSAFPPSPEAYIHASLSGAGKKVLDRQKDGRCLVSIRKSIGFTAAALIASVLFTVPVQGTTAEVVAEVRRTLTVADERFGGCMVALSVSPSDEGLDCPTSKWVTFSCSGTHTSKSNALRMYDSAQLAFVTGREVRVWVDDTRKHNGHCFVSRLDVMAAD